MIVYGKNPVFEAFRAKKAHKVYIRRGTALYDITFDIPVQVLDKQEFDARFHKDAQGVAAEADDIETISLNDATDLLKNSKGAVILDRIQDPHNYGAIIRSAHCFGVDNIIVPRYHQSPITPTVCKASAGAVFYSNIIEVTNLSNTARHLKDLGYEITAMDMDADEDISDYKQGQSRKTALIIGSEGKGVRDGLAETADRVVRIPMEGQIDSLNAAQSAAIALFQIFMHK